MLLLKMALSVLLMWAGSGCCTSSAQTIASTSTSESDFVPVYQQYADTINREGAAGFRTLATSDFVTYTMDTNKKLRGLEAFAEITKRLEAIVKLRGNRQFTVCFSVARFSNTEALVYTEEVCYGFVPRFMIRAYPIYTARFMEPDSVNLMLYEQKSSRWKQTWKKTPEGWKMTSLDKDTRTETEREVQDFFRYVVKSVELEKGRVIPLTP